MYKTALCATHLLNLALFFNYFAVVKISHLISHEMQADKDLLCSLKANVLLSWMIADTSPQVLSVVLWLSWMIADISPHALSVVLWHAMSESISIPFVSWLGDSDGHLHSSV